DLLGNGRKGVGESFVRAEALEKHEDQHIDENEQIIEDRRRPATNIFISDWKKHFRLENFNRDSVAPSSPGWPLRLPWDREGKTIIQPQGGCVEPLEQIKRGRNRFAVGESTKLMPRVAEAATLGWWAQPRCGSTRTERQPLQVSCLSYQLILPSAFLELISLLQPLPPAQSRRRPIRASPLPRFQTRVLFYRRTHPPSAR